MLCYYRGFILVYSSINKSALYSRCNLGFYHHSWVCLVLVALTATLQDNEASWLDHTRHWGKAQLMVGLGTGWIRPLSRDFPPSIWKTERQPTSFLRHRPNGPGLFLTFSQSVCTFMQCCVVCITEWMECFRLNTCWNQKEMKSSSTVPGQYWVNSTEPLICILIKMLIRRWGLHIRDSHC